MSGTLGRARVALASKDFRALLSARLVSQFADGVFQAYLVDRLVFLAPENQSTVRGVVVAFAVLIVPFSLLGPFAGVLIDRWSRRRILVVTPLLRTATVLVLTAFSHGAWLYPFALIIVSANRFFLATAGAVMPLIVPEEDLLVANSLNATFGTVATFVGLLVGTQAADAVGDRTLLLACAVAWPVGSLLASRIRHPLSAPHPGAGIGKMLRELSSGFRRLAATPAALASVVSITVDQVLVGIVIVLSVVVFKDEFRAGIASYGRITAAAGVGVLVGALTVGWFENRMAKPRIVAMAFAVAGAVALAVTPVLRSPTILLLSFTLGLTFPWRKIPSDTIVQEAIPDRYRGRVFALYDIGFSMARVAAALIAAALLEVLSVRWILALIGLAYVGWAPLVPWWVRRPRWVRLRFYAGATADETPRALVVGGEEEAVEFVDSWREERDGERVRRFRVRTEEGEVLDLVGGDHPSRWRVERERPGP